MTQRKNVRKTRRLELLQKRTFKIKFRICWTNNLTNAFLCFNHLPGKLLTHHFFRRTSLWLLDRLWCRNCCRRRGWRLQSRWTLEKLERSPRFKAFSRYKRATHRIDHRISSFLNNKTLLWVWGHDRRTLPRIWAHRTAKDSFRN